MKSPVYFASLVARSDQESTVAKVQRLFDAAGFSSCVQKHDRTAIKLHFGELGNDSYISPVFVRQVVEKVKRRERCRLSPTRTRCISGAGRTRLTIS